MFDEDGNVEATIRAGEIIDRMQAALHARTDDFLRHVESWNPLKTWNSESTEDLTDNELKDVVHTILNSAFRAFLYKSLGLKEEYDYGEKKNKLVVSNDREDNYGIIVATVREAVLEECKTLPSKASHLETVQRSHRRSAESLLIFEKRSSDMQQTVAAKLQSR
ncbi:hypothetical protein HC928_02215 [bacterium]|nr:hypothetical protein [bacterium]